MLLVNKTSKLFTIILSLALILAISGGSTLLLWQTRLAHHEQTEEIHREDLDIDVGIFAKQEVAESLLPSILASQEPEPGVTRLEIGKLDAAFVHSLNRFLSYFSEQSFSVYPTAEGEQQALVDFSYRYYKIHEPTALQTELLSDTLSDSKVDAVLQRFFGTTIDHEKNSYLYHTANDHRCRRFSIITAASQNADGSYDLRFDTYRIDHEDPEAAVPEEYYDLQDLEARANTRIVYTATGTATVEQVADGFRMLEYHSGTSQTMELRAYDSAEQYRINAFLSTFSEQLYTHYDPEDRDSLIRFVYHYLSLNQPSSVTQQENTRVITKEQVDTTLSRFFGITLNHSREEYAFHEAMSGFRHYYSIVTAVRANPDGSLWVDFDVYAIVGAEYIPEDYYWFTKEEAERDWYSAYCGSGTADLRDYTSGDLRSYQALRYETEDLAPPYSRRDSDLMVENTYLFTYLSRCSPSDSPSATEVLALQEVVTACCRSPLDFLFDIPVQDLQYDTDYLQTEGQRARFVWRAMMSDPYFAGVQWNASPPNQTIQGAAAVEYEKFASHYAALFGVYPDPDRIQGQYCNEVCNFLIEDGMLYGSMIPGEGYTLCLKKPVFSYDSSKQLFVITMDLLTEYTCTEENGTHRNTVTFPYMEYSDVQLMVYPEEMVVGQLKLYLQQVDGQYRYHSCILSS